MHRRDASETNLAAIFLGQMAPGEHVVQFYSDDNALLETLAGFVSGGLNAGESAIVIAPAKRLRALGMRLASSNVDLVGAMAEDRYITLEADAALSSFMVDQWPNEALFGNLVERLFDRASANNRPVRAFGEMIAVLWARGQAPATVRLEYLWNRFRRKRMLSLLCAYPKAGFVDDPSRPLAEICAAHTIVI